MQRLKKLWPALLVLVGLLLGLVAMKGTSTVTHIYSDHKTFHAIEKVILDSLEAQRRAKQQQEQLRQQPPASKPPLSQ